MAESPLSFKSGLFLLKIFNEFQHIVVESRKLNTSGVIFRLDMLELRKVYLFIVDKMCRADVTVRFLTRLWHHLSVNTTTMLS